ncbi:hypothetical protein Tco_0621715 [Tanacetum coccineum]
MNALVDQGSDVNVMPLSTYMKLIDERPTKTDIRLSLASHSYIYPLGIVEDVLVEVAKHVSPGIGRKNKTSPTREMKFDQWKSKNFKGKHPALVKIEGGMDDEGEVTTWMAFRANICNLGSFGEETDKITDLHQIHEEVLFTKRGDGVMGIKRRHLDLSSDGVRDLATASGRGRLKEDLESST